MHRAIAIAAASIVLASHLRGASGLEDPLLGAQDLSRPELSRIREACAEGDPARARKEPSYQGWVQRNETVLMPGATPCFTPACQGTARLRERLPVSLDQARFDQEGSKNIIKSKISF